MAIGRWQPFGPAEHIGPVAAIDRGLQVQAHRRGGAGDALGRAGKALGRVSCGLGGAGWCRRCALPRQSGLGVDLPWQHLLGQGPGLVNTARRQLVVVMAQADQLQLIAVVQAMHRRVLPLGARHIEQEIVCPRAAGVGEHQGVLGGGIGEHLHRAAIGAGTQIDRLALHQLVDRARACRRTRLQQGGVAGEVAGAHQRRPIHHGRSVLQNRIDAHIAPVIGAHHCGGWVHRHQDLAVGVVEGLGVDVVAHHITGAGVQTRQVERVVGCIDRAAGIKTHPGGIHREQHRRPTEGIQNRARQLPRSGITAEQSEAGGGLLRIEHLQHRSRTR